MKLDKTVIAADLSNCTRTVEKPQCKNPIKYRTGAQKCGIVRVPIFTSGIESTMAVRVTIDDDMELFDWAENLAKFHELLEANPEVYQHQCWINEFRALEFRLITCAWHHDDKDFKLGRDQYWKRLEMLYKEYGVVRLTLAICDSTEFARLKVFTWLYRENDAGKPRFEWLSKKERKAVKEEVLKNITLLNQKRNICDPKAIFPCVATSSFLESLASTAQKCTNCEKTFTEGATMSRNNCGEHFKCLACSKYEQRFGCNVCIPFPVWQRYGRHESLNDVLKGRVSVYKP